MKPIKTIMEFLITGCVCTAMLILPMTLKTEAETEPSAPQGQNSNKTLMTTLIICAAAILLSAIAAIVVILILRNKKR